MQQFTIPQFIDVEAKIIGPITTRQFIIMLTGVIIGAISYKFADFALFLATIVFVLIMVGLFGFTKINGRPFHFFLLNFVQTLKKPKLRIWNNAAAMLDFEPDKEEIKHETAAAPPVKRYTTSRLAELSLIVDTGGAYRGEDKNGIKTESV